MSGLYLWFLGQTLFSYMRKLTDIKKGGFLKRISAGDLLMSGLGKANAKCGKTWIGFCLLPPICLSLVDLDAEHCLLDPHLGCNPWETAKIPGL